MPDNRNRHYWLLRLGFISCLMGLLVVGILLYLQIYQLRATAAVVTQERSYLAACNNFKNHLTEARFAVRSYVLTENQEYLSSYLILVKQLQQEVNGLKPIRANSEEEKIFSKIFKLLSELFANEKTVLDAQKEHGFEAAKHLIEDIDKRHHHEEIFVLLDEKVGPEQGRLNDARSEAIAIRQIIIVLVIVSLFVVVALAAVSVALFRHVSYREQMASQLKTLNDELSRRNEDLESVVRVISHDLRAPLVNIRGFATELLKDLSFVRSAMQSSPRPDEVDEKICMRFEKFMPESIAFIQNSAAMMDQLTKNLVQVLRAGAVKRICERLDMNAIFDMIIKNLEFKVKTAGASISVGHLPSCMGDKSEVTQVFMNLVDNAIKYLDKSRLGRIQVTCTENDNKIIFCVEDNGRGIGPKDREKIFEIFYRVTPDKGDGEGIGLAIVKRLVLRNEGSIWVESELGQGSKFFVALPIAE